MKITKTEQGLSVVIPEDVAAALGLKEGDDVELRALDARELAVVTEKQRRAALLAQLDELAVPFPPGYKFDREEANAR